MLRRWRVSVGAALLFALGGALLGAVKLGFHASLHPIYRNFFYQHAPKEGLRRFAFAQSSIYFQDLGCGPFEVSVQVRSGIEKRTFDVQFVASHRTLANVRARQQPQWVHLRVPDSDRTAGIEQVDVNSDLPPNPFGFGLVIDDIRSNPWEPCDSTNQVAGIMAARALSGLAFGLFLWILVWPLGWDRWLFGVAARADRQQDPNVKRSPSIATAGQDGFNPLSALNRHRARIGAFIATWSLLFLLFALWALIRPPGQAPDEFDHFARILSMAREPWIVRGQEVRLPAALMTPYAMYGNTPDGVRKLIFNHEEQVTSTEIKALKGAVLKAPATDDVQVLSRAWAYPPAYYLPVYLVGRGFAAWLELSPYDAFYTYRLASAAVAAVLWTLVATVLGRVFTARRDRLLAFILMVSTPMVAFLSGSLNADAAMLPLALLATLLVWDLATAGRGRLATMLVLVALALSKPAAVVVIANLAGVLILLATVRRALEHLQRRRTHSIVARYRERLLATCPQLPWSRDAVMACVRAMVATYLAYYAWASPRLLGVAADHSLAGYLRLLRRRAPDFWTGFWGHPGWLDYRLDGVWYVALAVICALNIIYYLADPSRRYGRFAFFAVTSALTLSAALLIGEILTMSRVGLTLQGRYFLPAIPALAVLLMHRGRVLRLGLVALVIVCHVLLIDLTAHRYYADGWRGVAQALPYRD